MRDPESLGPASDLGIATGAARLDRIRRAVKKYGFLEENDKHRGWKSPARSKFTTAVIFELGYQMRNIEPLFLCVSVGI